MTIQTRDTLASAWPVNLAGVLTAPSLPLAACCGASEPLWDDRVDGETPEDREDRHYLAKAICGRCAEAQSCAEARRDDPTLPAGIWGGCYVGSGPERTYSRSLIRVDRQAERWVRTGSSAPGG